MTLENMEAYFNGLVSADGKHWRAGVTNGAAVAYRAWKSTVNYGGAEIEIDAWNTPDKGDVPAFVSALREAGAPSVIVTSTRTDLMELIHGLIANGATLAGPCVLEKESLCLDGSMDHVPGLRFTISPA